MHKLVSKSIWTHSVALVLYCGVSAIIGFLMKDSDQASCMILGVVGGYYTLLSCWLAYGTAVRRWRICIAIGVLIYLLQVVLLFLILSGLYLDLPIVVALAIVNIAFLATKYFANRLLTWVSRISLRHRDQLDSSVSVRLRYGVGELMLATGLVAVILALAQLGQFNFRSEILEFTFLFALVGFFHFILFWPVLVAALTDHKKWLNILIAASVFVAMMPLQVYVFNCTLGSNAHALWWILSLDLPFALCIAVHLGIANYQGYSLVTSKVKFEADDSSNEVFAD